VWRWCFGCSGAAGEPLLKPTSSEDAATTALVQQLLTGLSEAGEGRDGCLAALQAWLTRRGPKGARTLGRLLGTSLLTPPLHVDSQRALFGPPRAVPHGCAGAPPPPPPDTMEAPKTATARKALKVAELKELLAAWGLAADGTKAVLLERLEQHVAAQAAPEPQPQPGAEPAPVATAAADTWKADVRVAPAALDEVRLSLLASRRSASAPRAALTHRAAGQGSGTTALLRVLAGARNARRSAAHLVAALHAAAPAAAAPAQLLALAAAEPTSSAAEQVSCGGNVLWVGLRPGFARGLGTHVRAVLAWGALSLSLSSHTLLLRRRVSCTPRWRRRVWAWRPPGVAWTPCAHC
jgi:hypothetical protein